MLWLVTASMRCPAQEFCALAPVRRLANVSGVPHVAFQQVLFATREEALTQQPRTILREQAMQRTCAGKPARRSRVPRVASNPNPNPIGQKFVSSPPSIIIAKALPFAHYALRTFEGSVNHSKAAALSLLRLPHGCKNHHGDPPAQRAPHGTI